MNNKKRESHPLFAEVKLSGDEFRQSVPSQSSRVRYLKVIYPNDVTLILPGDISAHDLEEYIRIKV